MNDTCDPWSPADLSNWRTAPFSRWAFRHVERIIPCATIAAEAVPGTDFEADPAAVQDFRHRLQHGVPFDIDSFFRRTVSDALLIIHDGRLVFEAYDEGMSVDSTHILMSASKSLIGLLCGALVERRMLDVEATVGSVIPELGATVYGQATVRHLLDMRVAPGFSEATRKAYEASTGWEPAPPGQETTGLHDFYTALPPSATPPGGPFAYVSANTDLLGWVIERSTGKTVAALTSELLWSPMGATNTGAITLDRRGAPRCTGGFCATARDFARIGQLVADGGEHRGTQVVPASWIDDMAEQGDRDAWRHGEFAKAFGPLTMRYRSGWYVLDDLPTMLFAMGIHGQHLFVDRAHRLVIAKLSSQPNALDQVMTGLTLRAVAEIRRRLAGEKR